jgi:hypothetical protein
LFADQRASVSIEDESSPIGGYLLRLHECLQSRFGYGRRHNEPLVVGTGLQDDDIRSGNDTQFRPEMLQPFL